MTTQSLSVVIPSFNEECFLPLLLESINRQTEKPIEIIVADNESEDGTASVARRFGCCVVRGASLPGVARNNGAKLARGEYILFLDSDVILPDDFIELLTAQVRQRRLDCASCSFEPLSDRLVDKAIHRSQNLIFYLIQRLVPVAPGFCILCSRTLYDRIGGFDESIAYCEDQRFAADANKLGRFAYLKSPRLFVSVRRYDKEGRWNMIKKMLATSVLHLITGKYDFYEHDLSGWR